jgi:hypothetical protein
MKLQEVCRSRYRSELRDSVRITTCELCEVDDFISLFFAQEIVSVIRKQTLVPFIPLSYYHYHHWSILVNWNSHDDSHCSANRSIAEQVNRREPKTSETLLSKRISRLDRNFVIACGNAILSRKGKVEDAGRTEKDTLHSLARPSSPLKASFRGSRFMLTTEQRKICRRKRKRGGLKGILGGSWCAIIGVDNSYAAMIYR